MRTSFIFLILLSPMLLLGQKNTINTAVFNKWQTVERPKISNDGNYVIYTIANTESGIDTLVVKSVQGEWKRSVANASSYNAEFSANSLFLFFRSQKKLCIMSLKCDSIVDVPDVSTFKISGEKSYLAYKLVDPNNKLVLKDLDSGKERTYNDVEDFSFDFQGNQIVIINNVRKSPLKCTLLQLVTLDNLESDTIWNGHEIVDWVFDGTGEKLAFVESRETNYSNIWLFSKYEKKLEKVLDDSLVKCTYNSLINSSSIRFSNDGKRLFLKFKAVINKTVTGTGLGLDVWSYKDEELQSEQLSSYSSKFDGYSDAVITLKNKRLIKLTNNYEQILLDDNAGGEYVLLRRIVGYHMERFWRSSAVPQYYIVNLNDGSRKFIANDPTLVSLSPNGNFVVYYDGNQRHAFSFDVRSSRRVNLTKNLPYTVFNLEFDRPSSIPPSCQIQAWLKNDLSLIIGDKYDLWRVSLAGTSKPICLTNGYGRKHAIVFRTLNNEVEKYNGNEIIKLVAFDSKTKENGFFEIDLTRNKDPLKLSWGPYLFHWNSISSFPPVKAKDTEVFIVRKMSEKESPNFCSTEDFKTLTPISSNFPERKFNWLCTELYNLTSLDGSFMQGVLYKPENFDSTTKYPVVFYFYEQLSDRLHEYIVPDASNGQINIPFLVSKGFLVFVPDIKYKKGQPGISIYNAVIASAKFLSRKPWIDYKKMAIQGHSFGGYEVNFLVSNTSLFACAVSASGISNLLSFYGSITRNGHISQFQTEMSQLRIGSSPWERLDLYLKNSPIINADKINTPLLIMHNEHDEAVEFGQGLELFTALRRMRKPSWLLQYDNGDHTLSGKDAYDFTIRMSQFFNHYLKDAPAPVWMTQGIPAKLKGVITGYDYDPSNNCGKDCKVCKTWNEKMKKDSAGTWKEIEKRKAEEHWQ